MLRRAVLGAVCACLLAGGQPALAARALGQPNIVVVMTDDMPALDGRLLDELPTIRSLFVRQGLTFTDVHSESPLCCPARAGFLTGLHTLNHGVTRNDAKLFDPSMTIATALHAAGYWTFLAGKYFNQYSDLHGAVPPGWDHFSAFGDADYYGYDLWNDGAVEHHGGAPADYSTDVVTARAVRLIEQAPRGRPLFAWIAPFAPHTPTTPAPRDAGSARCNPRPWSPASYDEADLSDKPAWLRAAPRLGDAAQPLTRICRSLLAVDDLVAAVRDALAATGRLDDTLLVFSGDNGQMEGEHRLLGKQIPYVTEIPFAVSWPAGVDTPGRTVGERLQNIDLAPTLCALAGCTLGPYPDGQRGPDGLSFASLLRRPDGVLGRDAVLDDMPEVTRPDVAPPAWYAITTTGASPLAAQGCAAAAAGGCRWHLIEYAGGERELYDRSNGPCWDWNGLSGDPCELRNLAGSPAYGAIEHSLHERLTQLRRERGAAR